MTDGSDRREIALAKVPLAAASASLVFVQVRLGGRFPSVVPWVLLATAAALAVCVAAGVLPQRRALAGLALSLVGFLGYVQVSAPAGDRGDTWYFERLNDVAAFLPGFQADEVWLSSVVPFVILWEVAPASGVWVFPDWFMAVLAVAVFVACAAIGLATRSIEEDSTRWSDASIGASALFVTALPVVFVVEYVELYPLAVPVGAAAAALVTMWWNRRLSWVLAATAVGLAALFHGLYAMLLVGVVAAAVVRGRYRLAAASVALSGVVIAVGAGLVAATSRYDVAVGNSGGGADGRSLGALGTASWANDALWAVVVCGALPAVLIALHSRELWASRREALILAAMAPAFWVLWGFDLGFPADIDLAASASVAMLPALCHAIRVHLQSSRVRHAALALVAATTIASASTASLVLPSYDVPNGCIHRASTSEPVDDPDECPRLTVS